MSDGKISLISDGKSQDSITGDIVKKANIEVLEDMLEEAKRGEFESIAIAFVKKDYYNVSYVVGKDRYLQYAAIKNLKDVYWNTTIMGLEEEEE